MHFNTASHGATKVKNEEGAPAYSLSPKLDLYAAVVTSALANKFYENTDDRLSRIRALVGKVDPMFTAKLAVYAREQMYLRSVPIVLAVELAKIHSGDSLISRTVSRIIQRADEITELLAYYQNSRTGTKKLNKLSKQIQKGLASVFNHFSEYQFAKYNRDAIVKLRDALFLVHPKSKDKEQQKIFDKIASNSLMIPETWEVKLTEAGKSGKEKRVVWEELVVEGKLGYMALLRNLRNLIEANISSKTLETVCKKLSDAEEVHKSRQFPFRFLSAYEELQGVMSPQTSMVLDALEEAIGASSDNIEGFGFETSVFIACDVSGSMDSATVSDRSKVRIKNVGLVLAMLLHRKCKAVMTGAFAERFGMFNLPKGGILANASALDSVKLGGSTNGYLAIQALIQNKVQVDKVMMFTDCQLWDSNQGWGRSLTTVADCWHEYKKMFPQSKFYIFDLAGYGNTPLSTLEKDVYFITGWSDRIFQVLDALERGESALKVIEQIDL